MENKINVGDQNTQQIGQNPVNQPLPISEKPKVNYWMIFTIILLIVLIGGAAFVFSFSLFTQKEVSLTNQSPSPKNELQNITFQTLMLSSTDLNDSETELYFSDANKLYKVSFDGSSPQKFASFPHNIGSVGGTRSDALKILKNGDIVVSTVNSKYEKVRNEGPWPYPDYKEISSEYHCYVIKNATDDKEEIDYEKYSALLYLESSTTGEKIYTKELANGQAEILVDKLDGTAPTKIGLLKEKLLNMPKCDTCADEEERYEKQHPGEFIPSFDGKFLLNKLPGGGGLGAPGIVISRDGSKTYKIDFYWYVSSAVWIGNNKLLTKAQDGKQKIYTFNEDGTFSESALEQDLGGYFSQNGLSPTKKYLLINNDVDNPPGISLFDFDKAKIITVEKEDRERLIQQYNLQDEIQIDPRISHDFRLIGWNRKGDKFLYSEQISPFAETPKKLEVREIKVCDVSTGKIYTVAKLHPHPANPDEYLLLGKPVADVYQFAIR